MTLTKTEKVALLEKTDEHLDEVARRLKLILDITDLHADNSIPMDDLVIILLHMTSKLAVAVKSLRCMHPEAD
jgi:hypothetical protein